MVNSIENRSNNLPYNFSLFREDSIKRDESALYRIDGSKIILEEDIGLYKVSLEGFVEENSQIGVNNILTILNIFEDLNTQNRRGQRLQNLKYGLNFSKAPVNGIFYYESLLKSITPDGKILGTEFLRQFNKDAPIYEASFFITSSKS